MNRRRNLVALGSASDEPGQDSIGKDEPLELDQEAMAEDSDLSEAFVESGTDYADAWEEDEPVRNTRRFIVPSLAIIAILGWTGFFGWVHQAEIASRATPAQWQAMIVDWSIPVLLVIALWLLAMRNSTREAHRFGETARLLASESTALEVRLAAVNRELSLARDFIASQSRDLESLGRVASERISEHADRLQLLIRENGDEVRTIGGVSDTALANMERLRDHLPVMSNAARDVANQIGNVGNTAQDQLDKMVAGFERLNSFGEASETQVASLQGKVEETLAALEEQTRALDQFAQDRFATLRSQSEDFRIELEARETDTLAAIRRRADELARELAETSEGHRQREEELLDAMQTRLGTLREQGEMAVSSLNDGQQEAATLWQEAIEGLQLRMTEAIHKISAIDEAAINSARHRLEALSSAADRTDGAIRESAEAFETEFARRRNAEAERQAEAIEAMQERIAALDAQIVERQQEHLAHVAGLAERGDALAERLSALDATIAGIAEQGREESARLGEAGDALTDRLSQSRAVLEESRTFIERLTDDSVRLLEIIRSSADHSEGALSESIAQAEGRLSRFAAQASALRDTIGEAETRGSALVAHMSSASEGAQLSNETLSELEKRLATLAAQSEALADAAQGELSAAIAKLETASRETLARLRNDQATVVQEIAERIGNEGTDAIAEAMRSGAQSVIAELEAATGAASERGRETAAALRDQLAKVNELAGNLESRVARARAQAEEQVDNDFTRRMALITESLNSTSIDISKAFDNEVTDTAWASYLRGDRGIFTRRAVRLLDNHEARVVSNIYEDDAEFRETVNRYIHDFEAMLRGILSTRDGNAIAVTMLSSDMGKLYVALAQAIERLRD